jgi:hypothetical protein
VSRLHEVPLHLADQRHAWTADLLDSLVDAHRQHVADMPPVTAWMVGMGAIAGMVARIERPEYHEDVLVGLLALAVGRLAEDGEAR